MTEGGQCFCSYSKIVFWDTPRKCLSYKCIHTTNSVTVLIVINWHGDASGYAEPCIIELFFENRFQWQFELGLLLFTVCTCV
jgi:hypothetical protein